jgi:hypothetical protein
MEVSSIKCSHTSCKNILPPEVPGEKSYKKCLRCRDRDKALAAKCRAEQKRKRADSGWNDAPRPASALPVDQNSIPVASCVPSSGPGCRDDSDSSDSGTEVSKHSQ